MSGITRGETAKLLGLAAAYDQRTIGEADVEAWHAVARIGRWHAAHAVRALLEHYTTNTERIMPAHINRTLTQRRNDAARTYRHQPAPPEVRGQQAEIEWERTQVTAHIDTCLDRWAAGDHDTPGATQ